MTDGIRITGDGTAAKPVDSAQKTKPHLVDISPSSSAIDLKGFAEILRNDFPQIEERPSLWSPDNDRRCTHELPKDPKTAPLKECSYHEPFPSLTADDLIISKKLAERIAKGISFIEQGKYGQVDLFTQGSCNTFHVHAMIPQYTIEKYQSSLQTEGGYKAVGP